MPTPSRAALLRHTTIAGALLSMGHPAYAQTLAAQGTPVMPAPDDAGVADIVVTAQRRTETAQRSAIAISAVNAATLAQANVTDVTGLTRLVPALTVQPATGTSVGFYLRGVGSLVGNAFTENPVAFNYNQIYIARPAALLGTFYDLERVEVLKGPQGTLYGRNATGGAINVIPNRPVLDKLGEDFSVEVGNYQAVHAQAAVNVPLGSEVAIRLAGQVASRQGYLSDGYDDENGQAVRASILYKPSSSFTAVIVADYFHQGGQGPGGVLVPGPLDPAAPPVSERIGGADPRSIAALTAAFPLLIPRGLVAPPKSDGFVDGNFYGITGNLEKDFGFAKLTLVSAYRESRPNYLGYNGGYLARVDEQSKQTSVELRLASSGTGRLNYVVGGYFFNEDQHSFNDFNQGLIVDTLFDSRLNDRSYAVFGQATYAIFPTFRLLAGGRYTWEDKSNQTTLHQTSFGQGPISDSTGSLSFQKFTYKAGAEWDVAPRSLLYANVSTGFKSGGFFIAALDNTYKPEKITAYTIGSKNRFFDNKVQLNVEGFYWDYSDQQVNYIGPGRTSATTLGTILTTANAGKSRIYGAEADVVLRPTRRDTLSADVQYLDGKYTNFIFLAASANGAPPRTNCTLTPTAAFGLAPPAQAFSVDCSGKPQINAPRWTVNVSYEHEIPVGAVLTLTPGGRTQMKSSRYLSPEYLPEEQQGAYITGDVFLTLANPERHWSLTAFCNNVSNRTLYAGTSLRPVAPIVYNILEAPRTYGVRLGASF